MANANSLELTMSADLETATSIIRGALSRVGNIFFVIAQDSTRHNVRIDYKEPEDPTDPYSPFQTTPSEVQVALEQLSLHSTRVRVSSNGATRDANLARQLHSGIYDSYLALQEAQAGQEPFL